MRFLFWGSAAVVAYVYAGYPLLLVAWARLAPKVRARLAAPAAVPGVSIVIAARNESARLPDRIANLLALDCPAWRRQIIVVSDGSTDDTEAVLSALSGVVDVVTVPSVGKAAALNAGVARAQHDILVFADARQTFATDALAALIAPLADETIGGVSGELILGCEPAGRRNGSDRRALSGATSEPEQASLSDDRRSCADRRADMTSTVADSVGVYWRYEKQLRRLESTVGSMLGATGAIYALRRELWRPLPEGTLLDDVLAPMRAVLAGRRVVFEPAAQAYDATTPDAAAEARRKIRTLTGNFQILWLEPRLLVPFLNPVWLQYMSHKVGRLVVPYAMLGLFTASVALSEVHPFYAVALAAQCLLYLLGGYGALLEMDRPLLTWPAALKRRSAANA